MYQLSHNIICLKSNVVHLLFVYLFDSVCVSVYCSELCPGQLNPWAQSDSGVIRKCTYQVWPGHCVQFSITMYVVKCSCRAVSFFQSLDYFLTNVFECECVPCVFCSELHPGDRGSLPQPISVVIQQGSNQVWNVRFSRTAASSCIWGGRAIHVWRPQKCWILSIYSHVW